MTEQYASDHRIFETIIGSRAFGTNDEFSDYDKAGIIIPGKEYFFGWKKFEQFDNFKASGDRVLYNFKKALKLMKNNNPNMLDILWIPEKYIIFSTKHWKNILEQKDLFLSKKVRYTYSGYAFNQLKLIKTHKRFLFTPPTSQPKRGDYNLPDISIFPTSQIKATTYAALEFIKQDEKQNFIKELDNIQNNYVIPILARYLKEKEYKIAFEWLQLGIKKQSKAFLSLGTKYLKEEYIEQAKKEIEYYNATKEWMQYCAWKKHRNKARAELERKFKFDTKNAAHLVRIMRMGKEILEEKTINVDRTHIDADELKAIKNGLWDFEKLEDFFYETDKNMNKIYKKSNLRDTPCEDKIDTLCINTIENYLYN